MIHDLSVMKTIFAKVDEILISKPELLEKDIEEIFDEFFDDAKEDVEVRNGVITRLIFNDIASINNEQVISVLTEIKYGEMLREYISYVLQNELNISLLKLLFDAYKLNKHNEIILFIIPYLVFEKEAYLDKLDTITTIINTFNNRMFKILFCKNYALLISEKEKEEIVFEYCLLNYSEEIKMLIKEIIRETYKKRYELFNKWSNTFLNHKEEKYKTIGLLFIDESLHENLSLFEENYSKLQYICEGDIFKELIPILIRYLIKGKESKYFAEVKMQIMNVRLLPKEFINICIYNINFEFDEATSICIELLNELINLKINIDYELLKLIDTYLERLVIDNPRNGIKKIFDLYETNQFNNPNEFVGCISNTIRILKHNQQNIIEVLWNEFFKGSISKFVLSTLLFNKVISNFSLITFFNYKNPNTYELIFFLEGMLLFCSDAKEISKITFIIAYYADMNLYLNYCIKKIYSNYPEALYLEANKYVASKNEYIKEFASKIIDTYNLNKELMESAYQDVDFKPDVDRQIAYQKAKIKIENRIDDNSLSKSILFNLFHSSKMKYGKRFGAIQKTSQNDYFISTCDYHVSQISIDLPIKILENPVGYIRDREIYLKMRGIL